MFCVNFRLDRTLQILGLYLLLDPELVSLGVIYGRMAKSTQFHDRTLVALEHTCTIKQHNLQMFQCPSLFLSTLPLYPPLPCWSIGICWSSISQKSDDRELMIDCSYRSSSNRSRLF